MIVRALAALGRREEADAIMARLDEESRQQYVRAEILAMGYAALGDLDTRLRLPGARVPGPLGRADLPPPGSGLRAAAGRSAVRGAGAEDRAAVGSKTEDPMLEFALCAEEVS